MFDGFISGLIIAFILSIFGIDKMVIEVMQPFFMSIVVTTSHYYIIFGIIGAISNSLRCNL